MKIAILNVQDDVKIPRARVRRLARLALSLLSKKRGLSLQELSIVFVDDEEIARVNEQFLHHRGLTDVISFDYTNGGGRVGEIVISASRAVAQAKQFRRDVAEELSRYVVHGLLHLAGHDDVTARQRRVMRRAEGELLAQQKPRRKQ